MSSSERIARPRRGAATKAEATMHGQLSDSDSSSAPGEDNADLSFAAPATIRTKKKATRPRPRAKTKPKVAPMSRPVDAPKPAAPTSQRKRKRANADTKVIDLVEFGANGAEDANEEDTDVSSALSSPGSFVCSPLKKPTGPSLNSSVTSVSPPRPSLSRVGIGRFTSSSSIVASLLKSPPPRKGKAAAKEVWNLRNIKKYAWVWVNEEGRISPSDRGCWWPAEIARSASNPGVIWRVTLFGEPPGGLYGSLPMPTPSGRILQPLTNSFGHHRFTSTTFQNSLSSDEHSAPSRKKTKKGDTNALIVDRWLDAVATLRLAQKDDPGETDEDDEDEDLPSRIFTHGVVSPSKPDPSQKPASKSPVAQEAQEPPELDEEVDLEGGPALAFEARKYWPAQTFGWNPQDGLYDVVFFDSTKARLPRTAFFIPGQDEFPTCEMGQVATQQPMDDLVDENDEAALLGELARIRAPAPSPTLPVPGNLCMRFMSEQFPYVAPVLLAVLAGTYTPAREAHIAFMEGGNKRARLCLARRTFGDLTDRQKGALDRLLRRWLFGDEDLDELAGRQRGTWGAEDDLSDVLDLPPSSSPEYPESMHGEDVGGEPPGPDVASTDLTPAVRPALTVRPDGFQPRLRGGADYESLNDLERLEYCTNVLKPEACYQLLLWQKGERTTLDVQADAEELRLHERALVLAEQMDIVLAVTQLRRQWGAVAARIARKGQKNHGPAIATGAGRGATTRRGKGTRSRPLR